MVSFEVDGKLWRENLGRWGSGMQYTCTGANSWPLPRPGRVLMVGVNLGVFCA